MACKTQEEKKSGRKEKPIDWDIVEEALKGGCTGTEIAAWFNIHHDNFYRRVREKYGMDFTSYASSVTPAGDMNIRMMQYRQALKGNTRLLIMLGQERLGQGKIKDDSESKELIIKTLQYIDAQRNNPSSQIHAQEISASGSEST